MFQQCRILALLALVLTVATTAPASAAGIFFGPTPYLSSADIPAGFYLGGSPTALETFEDGSLSFGIVASAGAVIGPGGLTDSVDADDGTIDGSGSGGRSWFSIAGSTGVMFTFSGPLPTAAGIVWTDGAGTTTFEAFDAGMVSLGTIGPVAIADGSFSGTTADDRFFGVQNFAGIKAIKLSNTAGGIEVDHVQFGAAVPEPSSSLALVSLAAVGTGAVVVRRRRRNRID